MKRFADRHSLIKENDRRQAVAFQGRLTMSSEWMAVKIFMGLVRD